MNARRLVMAALLLAGCSGPGTFEVRMAWGAAGPPTEPGATVFAEVRALATDGAPVEDAPVLREASPVAVAALVGGAAELAFTAVPNGARRVVVVEVRRGATRDAELLRYGASPPFAIVEGESTVVVVDAGLTSPPSAGLAGEALAVEGFAADAVVLLRTAIAPLVLGSDSGVRAEVSGFRTFPADRTACVGLGRAAAACEGRPGAVVAAPTDVACSAGACRYRLAWDVNTGLLDDCGLDPERGFARGDACARAIFVRYFDARGVPSNVYTRSVVLDTAPPRVVRVSVDYVPGTGNPLASPRAATVGTMVRLALTASEPLRAPPESIVARSPGGRITLARGPWLDGGLELTYTATIAAGDARSGTHAVEMELIDLAGNVADVAASLPPVELRLGPPTLVVDQARLSYLRAPAMRDRAEPLGRYTLPAGPAYFAIGPSDPLDDSPALGADVARLADGPATALRVWADAQRTQLVLPLVAPDAEGRWPRDALELPTVDRARVYLSGVDVAGNESAPVLVENVWYVGSSAPAARSPHLLSVPSTPEYPRSDARAVTEPVGGAPDGVAVVRELGYRWREYVTPPATPEIEFSEEFVTPRPEDRTGAAAWDPTRGEVLLTTYLERTGIWAWDGVGFSDRTPGVDGLGERDVLAMAYDRARGRGVAVASQFAETWTWDGAVWTRVPTAVAPTARVGHAIAYDEAREEVVLLGGVSVDGSGAASAETWTWDGLAWLRHAGPSPALTSPGLAFDPISRRLLAFGGAESADGAPSASTWAWDGVRWTDVTPSGPGPAARVAAALVHDEARGRLVLTSGLGAGRVALTDTWEWDGGRWVLAEADGAFGVGSATYDGHRRQVVGWGRRREDDRPSRMLGWDGRTWRVVGGFDRPPPLTGRLLYADTTRGQSTTLAPPSAPGGLWRTWRFDGLAWTWTATVGPPVEPNDRYSVGYDALRDRAVLVVVRDAGAETWTFDGARWQASTATNTPAMNTAAMAFHAGTGELLLFGGTDAGSAVQGETWTWDGARWRRRDVPGPAARTGNSMAYDAVRGRVVMYYGFVDAGQGDGRVTVATDIWEWDGAAWHERPAIGAQPVVSENGLLFYDTRLRRVVAMGSGVWIWDGSTWVDRSPSGRTPFMAYTAGVAYEPNLGSALYFGSDTYYPMWRLEATLPALQLTVRLPDDVPLEALGALVVRGACGGRADRAPGARLLAFRRAGGWATLAQNTAPPEASAPLVGSAVQGRAFIVEGERALYLQCRPPREDAPELSAVALDYLEARVRYTAQPEVP